MNAYRISLRAHSWDKSGMEAARLGGRWNSKGRPAIYLATNLSLALMELYVRLGGLHSHENWVITEFDIPIDLALDSWSAGDLPYGWNMTMFPHVAQSKGDAFLAKKEFVGVMLPSMLIPQEYHILLNPLHADIKQIALIGVEEMSQDLRITKY